VIREIEDLRWVDRSTHPQASQTGASEQRGMER
jgi:hypothetical protein